MKLRGRLTYHLSAHTRATVLRLWARAIESMPYLRFGDVARATDLANLVVGYVRDALDQPTAADLLYQKDVGKGLTDTPVVSEELAYAAIKALADVQAALDDFARSVEYERTFTEAATSADDSTRNLGKVVDDVVDQYNEEVAQLITKGLTDTASGVDAPAKSTTTLRLDTPRATDSLRRTPGKTLADIVIQSESLYVVHAGIRSFTDTPLATDALSRSLTRPLFSEAVAAGEVVSMSLVKSIAEESRYALDGYFDDFYVTAGTAPQDSVSVTLNP